MITDSCVCGAVFTTKQRYWCEESANHKEWLSAHECCRKLANTTCLKLLPEGEKIGDAFVTEIGWDKESITISGTCEPSTVTGWEDIGEPNKTKGD